MTTKRAFHDRYLRLTSAQRERLIRGAIKRDDRTAPVPLWMALTIVGVVVFGLGILTGIGLAQ